MVSYLTDALRPATDLSSRYLCISDAKSRKYQPTFQSYPENMSRVTPKSVLVVVYPNLSDFQTVLIHNYFLNELFCFYNFFRIGLLILVAVLRFVYLKLTFPNVYGCAHIFNFA